MRVRNLYTLHSVLGHSGGVHGGHYYSFIRPTLSDQWFKFDDEFVTKEGTKRAVEEHYGGEYELPQANPGLNNTPLKFPKSSNAYILMYIRKSDKDKIICNVDEKDIAEHLRIRLKKEEEEKEYNKKRIEDAHRYTFIKVAQDQDLVDQIGRDCYFGLVDHDKVPSCRFPLKLPSTRFKALVAKQTGIPVHFQRFWLWADRQDHTYRPYKPLTKTQSVGYLSSFSSESDNLELRLFLEVQRGPDLRLLPLPQKSAEDILIFFKLYDAEKEKLSYVGRLLVKGGSKPLDILTKLNAMVGCLPNEEIDLYQETKPTILCEKLDKKLTFQACKFEDGEIICFQKLSPNKTEHHCRYPDVASFLEYVHNRQVVHFRSLEKPKEEIFCLELSKYFTYDDVVERVARRLGLGDPTKIRLTSHNCYSQQPKTQPIMFRGVNHLLDMLGPYKQTSDILYYEILDIPLPGLEGLKTLKVVFHHAANDKVVTHNIQLPKQRTVRDVISDLKTKVELSHPNAELRLLEIFHHKIYKIFPQSEMIENINDQYSTLRAAEIPIEEINLSPHDRLIRVYHFTRDASQNQMVQTFGEPFFLVVHDSETLSEVKVRIQKKLQVPDEEFSKWKFAFFSLDRHLEYLQNSDIVSTRLQSKQVWEIGLEHSYTAPKRAYSPNQIHHALEKQLEISD